MSELNSVRVMTMQPASKSISQTAMMTRRPGIIVRASA
jgi:hypothetical protein